MDYDIEEQVQEVVESNEFPIDKYELIIDEEECVFLTNFNGNEYQFEFRNSDENDLAWVNEYRFKYNFENYYEDFISKIWKEEIQDSFYLEDDDAEGGMEGNDE